MAVLKIFHLRYRSYNQTKWWEAQESCLRWIKPFINIFILIIRILPDNLMILCKSWNIFTFFTVMSYNFETRANKTSRGPPYKTFRGGFNIKQLKRVFNYIPFFVILVQCSLKYLIIIINCKAIQFIFFFYSISTSLIVILNLKESLSPIVIKRHTFLIEISKIPNKNIALWTDNQQINEINRIDFILKPIKTIKALIQGSRIKKKQKGMFACNMWFITSSQVQTPEFHDIAWLRNRNNYIDRA